MGYIKKTIKSNPKLFASLKHVLLYLRYSKALLEKGRYKGLEKFRYQSVIDIKERKCHCYFGYYDKSPISSENKYALFLKVPKIGKEGSTVDVCIYDLSKNTYKKIGETCTWNWQQGAMEQWIDEHTLSYNNYDSDKKEYQTIRVDLLSMKQSASGRAAYFYNRDFSKYLSLNFYRLDLFAKGYGYPYETDSMKTNEDGIWEVDVAKNKPEFILSLADVMDFEKRDYFQCQHYINHVAYCPDERYIIFIHRWQVKGREFVSRLLKYDKEGRELMTLLDNGHVSHYTWKDENTLFIYATDSNKRKGYMEIDIQTAKTKPVDGLPDEDGHPSFSKDGRWILTDTYPDHKRKQYLFLFDNNEKKLYLLDKLYSPFKYFNDFRCDLHPRWSNDNQYVCVDNTQTGLRSLKIYKLA